jgi:predicted TIM-barrel fold metal-dependent hydrolase
MWGNVVVARAAAHPWGAQRLLGYLLLSGVFDQFPNLRIGFSECSAGWLPAWLVRLRGQAEYMRGALPESVRDPLDYAREGRVFCGIELYEGEEIAKSINELLGDGVIMYQSDYPHNGCEFPSSPDIALSWTGIGEEAMRKLMYDNAARYLRMG